MFQISWSRAQAWGLWYRAGVCFQYKDHLTRYGDLHYKNKTVVTPYFIILWWEFPYWYLVVFILRWPHGPSWLTFIGYNYLWRKIKNTYALSLASASFISTKLKCFFAEDRDVFILHSQYLGHWWLGNMQAMGLLPDMLNCRLQMPRECQERFPRYCGLTILTCITARAWCTCCDACREC